MIGKRRGHFSHPADIGIRGIGATEEEAFEEAALALTAVITDPQAVTTKEAGEITCEAPDAEFCLFDGLNALIYEVATRKMLCGHFELKAGDSYGIELLDRERACVPIYSSIGQYGDTRPIIMLDAHKRG